MRNRNILRIIIRLLLCLLAVSIAAAVLVTFHRLYQPFGFDRQVSDTEKALRLQVVQQAESWLNANMADGSHRDIIDIYNAHTPLAVGYRVTYTDKWCAAFGSTVAIQCGITDIVPTECSCQRQIALFETLGCWEEDDNYIPLPGDYIFYSSTDLNDDDCSGLSDHVGIVVGTWNGYIKVIEGNFVGTVAYHVIPIGDISIRGFGLPDYESETQK